MKRVRVSGIVRIFYDIIIDATETDEDDAPHTLYRVAMRYPRKMVEAGKRILKIKVEEVDE